MNGLAEKAVFQDPGMTGRWIAHEGRIEDSMDANECMDGVEININTERRSLSQTQHLSLKLNS